MGVQAMRLEPTMQGNDYMSLVIT